MSRIIRVHFRCAKGTSVREGVSGLLETDGSAIDLIFRLPDDSQVRRPFLVPPSALITLNITGECVELDAATATLDIKCMKVEAILSPSVMEAVLEIPEPNEDEDDPSPAHAEEVVEYDELLGNFMGYEGAEREGV